MMHISCNMCSGTAFFFYRDNIRVGRQYVPIYLARCLKHQIRYADPHDNLSRRAYEEKINEFSVKEIMEC
jgi:hypothetical protein